MIFWSILAYFFIISAIIGSIFIWIRVQKYPQQMKIMNTVWVLTALWGSWAALWAYMRFGENHKNKNSSMKMDSDMSMESGLSENKMSMPMDMPDMKMNSEMTDKSGMTENKMSMPMDMSDVKMNSGMTMKSGMSDNKMSMPMPGMKMDSNKPFWQKVTLSALHCGAGCTLADIIGEGIGYFGFSHLSGWTIWWQWGFDYILALIIGVLFQFAAIRPMMKMSVSKTILRALRIDFFSLTSWQIGMYLFMGFIFFIYPAERFEQNSIMFWFLMQIAMLTGFLFAYPTNYILIKLKIKPAM